MRKLELARRVTTVAAVALICGLLYGALPVQADTVTKARGMAYGISENSLTEPNVEEPRVESVVPPPPPQAQTRVNHEDDVLVDVLGAVVVGEVESDACVQEGVSATLQSEINAAAGDPPPQTTDVTTEPGFNDSCVTRGRIAGSPTPGGSPGAGSPTPADTASPGVSPSPGGGAGGTAPGCSTLDPTTGRLFCSTTTPLWNARGYTFFAQTPIGDDLESEAVAGCENGEEVFQTGARFGAISGSILGADDAAPNSRLNPLGLGLVESAVVVFWETNWDPRNNSTTDGSDTVWVNAMHIITPAEEIIIGHAEASAECPGGPTTPPTPPTQTATIQPTPTPPEGGFPRDISLSPSKSQVLFSKVFTLSGAVTPANQFQTPRNCVEGVTLTLRRDPLGGPEEFVDVGTVVTDNEGNWTFNYAADINSQWLAFIDKDNPTDCALATSNARPVLVKPFVRLKLSQRFVKRGGTVRMRASLEPCIDNPGTRMKLKRSFDGNLVEIDTKALDANCEVEFLVQANFKEAVFQASWPKQSSALQTGQSRPKPVQTKRR